MDAKPRRWIWVLLGFLLGVLLTLGVLLVVWLLFLEHVKASMTRLY